MRAVQSVLIATMLFVSTPTLAQQTGLEDRLSAADFRAAGLDKLSATELARLNELLARERDGGLAASSASPTGADVEARIAQAREEGRRQARSEDRGIRPAAESREPIASTIPGAFTGFAPSREYTLANGQVWKQIDSASIAGARGQDIGVRIRPGFMGVWWLQVDGYNTQAKVERVR